MISAFIRRCLYSVFVYGLIINHCFLALVQACDNRIFVNVTKSIEQEGLAVKVWSEGSENRILHEATYNDNSVPNTVAIEEKGLRLTLEVDQAGAITVSKLNCDVDMSLSTYSLITFLAQPMQVGSLFLTAKKVVNESQLAAAGIVTIHARDGFRNSKLGHIIAGGRIAVKDGFLENFGQIISNKAIEVSTEAAVVNQGTFDTIDDIKIKSRGSIVVGNGHDIFGCLVSAKGSITLKAPQITALCAKLSADKVAKIVGNLDLGTYVEKSPNQTHKLGAWVGEAVDDHLKTKGNANYHSSNGTEITAAAIEFVGEKMAIGYARLLSYDITKIVTPLPLHLIAVNFMGQGNLSIDAPHISFNFAGTAKGLSEPLPTKATRHLHPLIYDYLLSLPSSINHMGQVDLKSDRVDFHGTSVAAKGLTIQGQNELGEIRFIPIPLGSAEFDKGFGKYRKSSKQSSYTVGINLRAGLSYLTDRPNKRSLGARVFSSIPLFRNLPLQCHPSVAEVYAYCQSSYNPKVAAAILRFHQNKEIFKYWAGEAVTPTVAVDRANLSATTIKGQVKVSAGAMRMKAGTLDLHNSTARDDSLKPMAKEIKLQDVASFWGIPDFEAKKLDSAQFPVMGEKVGDVLAVESWSPLFLSFLVQAALAEQAGLVQLNKTEMASLVNQIKWQSSALAQNTQGGFVTEAMVFQSVVPLLYYRWLQPTEPASLLLYIPLRDQSVSYHPGDLTFGKFVVKAKGLASLANNRLFIDHACTIKGADIILASTVMEERSAQGVKEAVHAPAELNLAEGATALIQGKDRARMIGVQASIANKAILTFKSDKNLTVDAAEMGDEVSIRHGKKTIDQHLITTILGEGAYHEQALDHCHGGAFFGAQNNIFKDGAIAANGIIDYEVNKSLHKSRKLVRKKRHQRFHQVPLDASQTTYANQTVLDVDYYKGEGVLFAGTLIDRTKAMTLMPLILMALHKSSKSRGAVGVTKGLRKDMGQEEMIQPMIKGQFFSDLHREASEEENVIKLTSGIIEVFNKETIGKIIEENEYVLQHWCKIKQTGNFKVVATVAALAASIASGGAATTFLSSLAINGMTNAVGSAAIASLAGAAASSMVNNQGNMGRSLKEVAHAKTVKSVAVAMVTAGALSWLAGQADNIKALDYLKKQQGITDHVLKNLTETGVRLHINFAANGGSFKGQLEKGVASAVVDGIAGFLTQNVDGFNHEALADNFAHKIMHASVGALHHAVLNSDALAGAVGAAVGAVTAETMAENYSEKQKVIAREYEEELNAARTQSPDGKLAKEQEIAVYNKYQQQLTSLDRHMADVGKYAALAAAVLTQCDPEDAVAAATLVMDNEHRRGRLQNPEEVRRQQVLDTKPLPLDTNLAAAALVAQCQDADEIVAQIESMSLSLEQKQEIHRQVIKRVQNKGESRVQVPLEYYSREQSPPLYPQLFELAHNEAERYDRPSKEVLQKRAEAINWVQTAQADVSKEECLNNWYNQLYPERPASPRTERRFFEDYSRKYESIRQAQPGIGVIPRQMQLQAEYEQGREYFIEQREKEFATGDVRKDAFVQAAALKAYEHQQRQAADIAIGGAIGLVSAARPQLAGAVRGAVTRTQVPVNGSQVPSLKPAILSPRAIANTGSAVVTPAQTSRGSTSPRFTATDVPPPSQPITGGAPQVPVLQPVPLSSRVVMTNKGGAVTVPQAANSGSKSPRLTTTGEPMSVNVAKVPSLKPLPLSLRGSADSSCVAGIAPESASVNPTSPRFSVTDGPTSPRLEGAPPVQPRYTPVSAGQVPGRVQSRINIRNGNGGNKKPGIESAWKKHGENAKDNKSKFTISKEELVSILEEKSTINTRVGISSESGAFVREVNMNRTIGRLPIKDGGAATKIMTVLTDKFGNLINAYPGAFAY